MVGYAWQKAMKRRVVSKEEYERKAQAVGHVVSTAVD